MASSTDLNLLHAFVAVHETGSFSRAGTRLGVPRSTVSRNIAALEATLDTVLFHRTTRRVTTTSEGTALYDRVAPSLSTIAVALREERSPKAAPSGVLRITATVDFAAEVLAEPLARFGVRYPQVKVELRATNDPVDIVDEGLDLALRISDRIPRGGGLTVRKIGKVEIGLYASPTYLARRGTPQTPDDLGQHDAVRYGTVPMTLRNGRTRFTPQMDVRFTCDEMYTCRALARHHAGIATFPSFLATADLAEGRLARVLPQWSTPAGSVYLLRPTARHIPTRVTAFRDILLETFDSSP